MSGTIEQSKNADKFTSPLLKVCIRCWHQAKIFSGNTSGATAVEYGLLAGLVAIGLAGGLGALADLVSLLFDTIGEEAAEVSNAMNENG